MGTRCSVFRITLQSLTVRLDTRILLILLRYSDSEILRLVTHIVGYSNSWILRYFDIWIVGMSDTQILPVRNRRSDFRRTPQLLTVVHELISAQCSQFGITPSVRLKRGQGGSTKMYFHLELVTAVTIHTLKLLLKTF